MDSNSSSNLKEYKAFLSNYNISSRKGSSNNSNISDTRYFENRESQSNEIDLHLKSQSSINLNYEFYQKENVIKETKYILMCKDCYFFPQINFKENNLLNIKCNCREKTNMEYGSITPIALPKDWMILVDPLIKEQDQIIIGGGLAKSKITLPTKLFLKIPNVEIVEGIAKI